MTEKHTEINTMLYDPCYIKTTGNKLELNERTVRIK